MTSISCFAIAGGSCERRTAAMPSTRGRPRGALKTLTRSLIAARRVGDIPDNIVRVTEAIASSAGETAKPDPNTGADTGAGIAMDMGPAAARRESSAETCARAGRTSPAAASSPPAIIRLFMLRV